MTVEIRSRRIARAAFDRVECQAGSANRDKYLSFARTFPTLIHVSGLAQATAFALAKGDEKLGVLNDLAQVMNAVDANWEIADGEAFNQLVRDDATDTWKYMRLTSHALQAATWIKRYAEALLTTTPNAADQTQDTSQAGEESEDATRSP